ncbi:MAG: hypothetical protein JJT96_12480 [Opitutales bacterium]|nr:hypothetical protein [Opitutales bacterium]
MKSPPNSYTRGRLRLLAYLTASTSAAALTFDEWMATFDSSAIPPRSAGHDR